MLMVFASLAALEFARWEAYASSDADGDGLNDYEEYHIHLTDPNNADTDSDGLSDGNEVNLK